jgi:hypothetical protein
MATIWLISLKIGVSLSEAVIRRCVLSLLSSVACITVSGSFFTASLVFLTDKLTVGYVFFSRGVVSNSSLSIRVSRLLRFSYLRY